MCNSPQMATAIQNPTEKQLYWRNYHREYQRKKRVDPDYRLRSRLREHGITRTQYEAILTKQHGMCGFCGGPKGNSRFVIDHDHATGRVRGVIHWRCNTLLGFVRDNPETIAQAVRYLRDC